jgi:hypothetical protein
MLDDLMTDEEQELVDSEEEKIESSPLEKILENTILTDKLDGVPTEFDEIKGLIEQEESQQKIRPELRPNIDHLVDAVVFLDDGTPVFVPEVGEKVIIEKYASLLVGRPWLNTRLYEVHEIDNDSGRLKLWDVENEQWCFSNFIEAPRDHGYRFKLPTRSGKIPKHKARNNSQPEHQMDSVGRPTGTRNRPKEVIEAERLEREKLKAERRAKRDLNKLRKYAESQLKKDKKA